MQVNNPNTPISLYTNSPNGNRSASRLSIERSSNATRPNTIELGEGGELSKTELQRAVSDAGRRSDDGVYLKYQGSTFRIDVSDNQDSIINFLMSSTSSANTFNLDPRVLSTLQAGEDPGGLAPELQQSTPVQSAEFQQWEDGTADGVTQAFRENRPGLPDVMASDRFNFFENSSLGQQRAPNGTPYSELIERKLTDFQRHQMRDGQSLSNEQAMTLAAQSLAEAGVDLNSAQARDALGELFFQDYRSHTDNPGQHQIYGMELQNGELVLDFAPQRNTTINGENQTRRFEAPTPYNGPDNNQRRDQILFHTVGAAGGKTDLPENTEFMDFHSESFLNMVNDSLEEDYPRLAAMPPAERYQDPEFSEAMTQQRMKSAGMYLSIGQGEKGEDELSSMVSLQERINARNQAMSPDASDTEIVQAAIEELFEYKTSFEQIHFGPNAASERHASLNHHMSVEDEALLELTLRQYGIEINVRDIDQIKADLDAGRPPSADSFSLRSIPPTSYESAKTPALRPGDTPPASSTPASIPASTPASDTSESSSSPLPLTEAEAFNSDFEPPPEEQDADITIKVSEGGGGGSGLDAGQIRVKI